MSLTPQTITIDLNPSFSQMQTVHCSQYDDNIRQIEVKLKDGGTDVDVSSYTIYIEGTKPDKHGFSYPLTDIGDVSGNTVTFYVQLQMAAVPGMTRMEILLKDGDDHRIGSANFMLAVERAGLQDDTDVSDSELAPYISGAAAQAQAAANSAAAAEQAKDDAIQAKDDAIQAKESAEQSAESISGLSEQIEQNTEDCRDLKNAIPATDALDFSAYTGGMTSGIWRMPKVYPAGYVESIKGKISDSSTQVILLAFTDPTTNITIRATSFTGITGEFTLPINMVFEKPFGIGIYCSKLGTKVGSTPVYRTAISSCPVGTDVTGTSVGNYDLAMYPVYKTNAERFVDSVSEDTEHSVILGANQLSQFTNSILSGYWWTDYKYEAGYIDHITTKAISGGAGTKCSVLIIDSTNNKVLFTAKNRVFGSDLLATIPVHLYCENPVYIATQNVAYISTGGNTQYVRNTSINPEINDTLSYSWTGTANYKFGVQVTYKSVAPTEVKYCKTRRRMFISGDSITAGYPFNSIDGVKYGQAIGRALDYDVTFGAESGNGWLYSTGSANAYSITNDTDFSQFDVAIYAWGTNDFWHDMPLGNITDTYASQTVCGTMNYCIDKVFTDNPTAIIIISTPLNRTYNSGYGYTTANAQGYTLKDMVNKMIELCESRGVMYIDNTCSPFNPKTIGGLTGDGLHPNRIGYEVLGAYMSAKVGAMIQPYVSPSKGL